ncbi:MAG TPA: hypothetical protein PLE93_07135, partial [Solirubrobacterales bacterium]|nr:hypothetical protein [Solirubrobacterales bacterium]
MKLRSGPEGLMVEAGPGEWVSLPALKREATELDLDDGQTTDMVAFLAAGEPARKAVQKSLDSVDADKVKADPDQAGLPLRPRSMRAFMLWESHMIASSRVLV